MLSTGQEDLTAPEFLFYNGWARTVIAPMLRGNDKSPQPANEEQLLRPPSDRARILGAIAKANRLQAECGCALGAKFVFASAVIAPFYLIHRVHSHGGDLLPQIAFLVPVFVASGIVGKLTGIIAARVRRRLLLREIAALLSKREDY